MILINKSERIVTVGRNAIPPKTSGRILPQYAATDEVKAMVKLGWCELVMESGDEEAVATAEAMKLTMYDINRVYAPCCCAGGGGGGGTSSAEQAAIDKEQSDQIAALQEQLEKAMSDIEELEKVADMPLVDVTQDESAQKKDEEGNYDLNLYIEEGYFNFPETITGIKNAPGTVNGKLLVTIVDNVIYQTFTDLNGVEYGRTNKDGEWSKWVGYIDEHSVDGDVLIL